MTWPPNRSPPRSLPPPRSRRPRRKRASNPLIANPLREKAAAGKQAAFLLFYLTMFRRCPLGSPVTFLRAFYGIAFRGQSKPKAALVVAFDQG